MRYWRELALFGEKLNGYSQATLGVDGCTTLCIPDLVKSNGSVLKYSIVRARSG